MQHGAAEHQVVLYRDTSRVLDLFDLKGGRGKEVVVEARMSQRDPSQGPKASPQCLAQQKLHLCTFGNGWFFMIGESCVRDDHQLSLDTCARQTRMLRR